MSVKNKIELAIRSQLGFEKVAMDAASAVAKKMGFVEERVEDLRTAVSEACINAIEHGNQFDASVQVKIVLTMQKKHLEIDVQDEGKDSFISSTDDITTPDINKKISGLDGKRGLGMFFIKNLVDELEVTSDPEAGSMIKMVIKLEE